MTESATTDPQPEGPTLKEAGIGALSTIRVMCQPSDDEDKNLERPHWGVFAAPFRRRGLYTLVGDLYFCENGWTVGATVNMQLALPDTAFYDVDDLEMINQLAQDYAPWATHVMWDHAVTAARTVIACCPGAAGVQLPNTTPPARIARLLPENLTADE